MAENSTTMGTVITRCVQILATAALIAVGVPARAETVIDRIARTGQVSVGTRTDAMPFGYRDEHGRIVGFSVDLAEKIREALEKRLARPIALTLVPIAPKDRVEKVQSGAIDIECGITTPTWDREDRVDFSIPFFVNGTRIMALRSTARSMDDLRGKRIGAVVGSTTDEILTQAAPDVTVVSVADMNDGLAKLQSGEIDGLSNVGIVLRAQVEGSPLKSKVLLLPRTGALSYEYLACVLPKNESEWRDLVNHVFANLLDGANDYRGGYIDIYERWFGLRGTVYFPLDSSIVQRLTASVIWLK